MHTIFRKATVSATLFTCLGSDLASSESLAGTHSPRLKEIRAEIDRICHELSLLPEIPLENLGGDGAYGRLFALESRDMNLKLRFTWPEDAPVDFISLIPARKFTATGLAPEYGFPEDFSISLITSDDDHLVSIVEARDTSSHPVRRGHPYNFELDLPIKARGLEINVSRLRIPSGEKADILVFALAEIFCFAGEHNLMENASITTNPRPVKSETPYWTTQFMIDGHTPLGLPEIPLPYGAEWNNIGWVSQSHPSEEEVVSVTIKLKEAMTLDGMSMFPARRPSVADFPGFGLPSRFRVETSMTGGAKTFETVYSTRDGDIINPGSNPLTIRFEPVTARVVRLSATKLWKDYDHYPAFLALSEIQILNGHSILSNGARVATSELTESIPAHGHKNWSPAALTDRHGPSGEIVSRKQWLRFLDRRLALQVNLHTLRLESEAIERKWSRSIIIMLGAIGISGLLAALILPFRYRRLERKRLRSIRDRIAGDLHDDVGSNLGSIQLLSEIAKSKTESQEELILINQVAAETVTSVRDIVWLLRPRNGYRASTIAHLRDTASILLESIEWTFNAETEEFALNDEDGRHLVLFFREALHNLIRHSKAAHASIRLSRKDTLILLEIRDDGRGIAPELLDRPETLRALKQRSIRLGASLEINSEIGKGTFLRLAFTPQALDFYKAPRYPFSIKTGHS
ncbi:histidine kinase [Haloferula chungangensis]|uniref:Histidine kinase n=1 Tax=Haloferula chungangensis TaxID=1048331 RepID=A0ABW2L143_9BACT